ncbi:DUF1573 domain-containing protein [Bacteroides mediterraneensis]|uniref:DUF1573 domain-containing protein n=1 Tax=Bacteroides mediterraneensis TaxID=1841856 RepID=UPI000932134D|nr:DUF1573 domain-containing protein [Bacteroides mediterraneensis]
MKKILFTTLLCVMNILFVIAQGTAQITFEKTTYNFGSFSENSPKVTCKFKFTNTGDGPLVIHQAIASCGCTVPQYPKEPIKPGESGEVTVTYNGAGKFPGHFRKTITLRTNSKNEITRLVVEGDMTPASADANN